MIKVSANPQQLPHHPEGALPHPPTPVSGESPTAYADRVGTWYVAKQSARHRKQHGLYLTPVAVAEYMARRIDTQGRRFRVLDPAAGAGVLCCAVVERLASCPNKPAHVEVVAYEVDAGLAEQLRGVFAHLAAWARQRGLAVVASVQANDFVAAHAARLPANGELFAGHAASAPFDVVIANPPYFKIAKADPRALALAEVVHGQPNIYALFMAVAAAMLRQEGRLVFITPRSFASGPYFRKFRDVFFRLIEPTCVHVFRSRRNAFRRDDVLQENVILTGVRRDGWQRSAGQARLRVSSSEGQDDIGKATDRTVPMTAAIDLRSSDKVLRLPTCAEDEDIVNLVDAWPTRLHALGLNISTGPVVAFRAAKHIDHDGNVPRTHAPLLWMNHVRPLRTTWPLAKHKPEYIAHANAAALLVPNKNYVLLRRFSAKEETRRLTAAPCLKATLPAPLVGFENHLNYVHRPSGELGEDETWGLAALYSSRLLDAYFRIMNGNTQVSATEIRAMPLPAHEAIVALGRSMKKAPDPVAAVDRCVLRLLAPWMEGVRVSVPIRVRRRSACMRARRPRSQHPSPRICRTPATRRLSPSSDGSPT